MKNLVFTMFVLCVLFSCKPNTASKSQNATTEPDTSVVTPGPDPVTFELAKRMVKNFEPHIGQRTKPDGTLASDEGNTRAVWLDLKKLEAFVEMLKKERDSNKKTDGVRVYFGTYGDNTKEPTGYGLDPENSFRNTLVFVSTKDSLVKENNAEVHYHQDYFKNEKAFILTEPVNKGELCPPPTKCCQIGATLTCP